MVGDVDGSAGVPVLKFLWTLHHQNAVVVEFERGDPGRDLVSDRVAALSAHAQNHACGERRLLAQLRHVQGAEAELEGEDASVVSGRGHAGDDVLEGSRKPRAMDRGK